MKVVSTPNAPAAIGPYSQALDLGNMVFVSGQIPVDPATGKMADTVEEQAAQSLANLKAILAEAGLDDVAEEHFVNLFGFDPGAFQGFPNDNFSEFDGGNVGERAAKFADSCAAGAEDSDIVLHKLFLSCRAFVSAAS